MLVDPSSTVSAAGGPRRRVRDASGGRRIADDPADPETIRRDMLRSLHATILDPHAKSVERLEAQKMLAKMLGATVGPDDAAPISRAADGQRAAQHRPRGMCAECCATTRAVVARLRQLEAALDDLERRDNAPVW